MEDVFYVARWVTENNLVLHITRSEARIMRQMADVYVTGGIDGHGRQVAFRQLSAEGSLVDAFAELSAWIRKIDERDWRILGAKLFVS